MSQSSLVSIPQSVHAPRASVGLNRLLSLCLHLTLLCCFAQSAWSDPSETGEEKDQAGDQAVSQGVSQDAPTQPARELEVAVIEERLPNGLTLLMNPDHRIPTVAVEVRYLVGSAHERPGRSGFAHLFEHLMFQGSKNYDQEYFTPFTPIGGKVNGTTNTDRTNYYEQVPAEALELALWMESDRMEGLLDVLTQAKLDNQRDVVKNERRQRYENTPYGMVWKVFANHLYPEGHPYHHTTIGSHADLSAANLDDVKAFFKRYYVPANAIITLAGDFDPQEARALVARYFGHLPSGERAPRPIAPALPERGARAVTLIDDVKLPRVYLAWHTPALYAPGDAEMDILATLLTDGKSSALYQPLVFEDQVAKDVFAFQVSRGLGSMFVVGATAAPGRDLAEVSAALQAKLEVALKSPPQPAHFERAINQWRKRFYSEIESVMSRAKQMSNYHHLLGRPDAFNFDLARYTTMKPAQVTEAAQHWLSRAPLTVRVIPKASAPNAPDRSAPPALREAKPWHPPVVEQFTMKNGIKVWLVNQEQSPLISLKLILNHGAASDPAELAGVTSLMASLLDEGAGERDALAVSDALKQLATDYGVMATQDHITFSLDMLAEQLKPSLALLSDFLTRPHLAEGDFKRVREQRVAAAIAQGANPRSARNIVMKRALFGEGHSGLPSDGLIKSLKAIKLADVKVAYQTHIKPRGATLIVVGAVNRATLEESLDEALSHWSGAPTAQPRPLTTQATPATIHWIDFPKSTQSALALARAIDGASHDESYISEKLFNLVFGGQFTSRLNLNLREDKGYTYGAYSGLIHSRVANFHFLGAMVKGDTTLDSTREMLRELTEITAQREVTQEEVARAQGGEEKGYPAEFEERTQVASHLADLVRQGRDVQWLRRWPKLIRDAQRDQVQLAARHIAQPERYQVIIAGDLKAHLSKMQTLGLPIIVYSAQGEILNKIPVASTPLKAQPKAQPKSQPK